MTMHRRSRGNDGHVYSTSQAVPLRASLVHAVLGETPRAPMSKRQALHCDKRARGAPASVIPDDVVLRIRALYEFAGMHPRRIAAATGIDIGRVELVLRYHNRVHLVAKPEHVNE